MPLTMLLVARYLSKYGFSIIPPSFSLSNCIVNGSFSSIYKKIHRFIIFNN